MHIDHFSALRHYNSDVAAWVTDRGMCSIVRSLRPLTILLVSVAFALAGCSTMRVGAHHDDSVVFSKFESFSWMSDTPLILGEGKRSPISPLAERKIIEAIGFELGKRYRYVDDPNDADFVVSLTVGTRERLDVTTYPEAFRGEWGWHLHGEDHSDGALMSHSYIGGTLGIDIFDGVSKEPIWYGWVTKVISDADRENPAPPIQRGVKALFERFPPEGSG